MATYKEAISQAKKVVEDEDEPFKSIAFKVILEKILESSENKDVKELKGKTTPKVRQKNRQNESEDSMGNERAEITFDIPNEMLPHVMKLEDRDKIPMLWFYSSRKSMTVPEFLVAAAKEKFNFAPSYLPSKGGNFNNRQVFHYRCNSKEESLLLRY